MFFDHVLDDCDIFIGLGGVSADSFDLSHHFPKGRLVDNLINQGLHRLQELDCDMMYNGFLALDGNVCFQVGCIILELECMLSWVGGLNPNFGPL